MEILGQDRFVEITPEAAAKSGESGQVLESLLGFCSAGGILS